MGRSQDTFSKRQKEAKRAKKKKDKLLKKEDRKANSDGGGLDNMIAYVDEFGNITDTPPEEQEVREEVEAENIEIGVPKREKIEEQTHFEGKVAFYNDSKGYGFINDINSGEKYFVHINGCLDEIQENDKVTFELERGQKGMNAVNVKVV
jgi:cold shock CspA family protein